MQEKSLRHQAALRFAESGIPIFPCLPDSKKPRTENGFHDATTNVDQINAWWAEADYNLAFTPHSVGWGIVDIDGPEGEAAWAELQEEHGQIDTFEVRSPRGGRHLYFEGELPTTAWSEKGRRNVGKHIDTRGRGSYALLPPSTFEGKPYVTSKDIDLAPVPDWITARLATTSQHVEAGTTGLDEPANIDRAVTFLRDSARRGDVAIEGQAGNNRTYVMACDLLNLGLTPEKAQELILEHWNPHCQPPWEDFELGTIIANASAYSQNADGAWGVASAADVFGKALDQLPKAPARPERRSRFYFEDIDEQDNAPDPVWMIPELIPDNATVLVLAQSGHFKSFIAEDIALSIASGATCFGNKPGRRGPTFYGAHEGRNELKKGRKNAWLIARQVDREQARGFYVAPAPFVAYPEQQEEFREQIRVRLRQSRDKIGCIVLDTAAKCMMGMDENKAQDAGVFVGFCDSLRDEFECPVIVLHHLDKAGNQQGRGSGALVAGFDTILNIKRVPETLAVEVRVSQHKDAEERKAPWYFEGRKIGSSLAFYPVTEAEHRTTVKAGDLFEPRKIGAALAELKAFGFNHGVSTAVLATAVMPPDQTMSPEDALVAQNRTSRALAGLARKNLEAYCSRVGRDLLWFLPEAPVEDDGAGE